MLLAITLTLLFLTLILTLGVPISLREYAAPRARWDPLPALLAGVLAAWLGYSAWWLWMVGAAR